MASNYQVILHDSHLGMINGRTAKQEAARINRELENLDCFVFQEFKVTKCGHFISGEIRGKSPKSLAKVFGIYEEVFYWVDNQPGFYWADKKFSLEGVRK